MRNHQRTSDEKKRAVSPSEAAKSRVQRVVKPIENTERKMDYSVYRLSAKERTTGIAMYLLLDAAISYLFFQSWIAIPLLFPGYVFFSKEQKKVLQQKRAVMMKTQFLDGIQMIAASLQAGYSAENALSEACKELARIYESDSFILREFTFMCGQITMSRSIEELFLDFGRRSGIDDILSFSEVFMTAKRSGGDLLAIIRNTVACIQMKQETRQEIETNLSGKVMEQNIMSVIPIGILAYIKVSSPEFLDAMYGNITGTAIMILCLVVYIVAFFWGRKIVHIEV